MDRGMRNGGVMSWRDGAGKEGEQGEERPIGGIGRALGAGNGGWLRDVLPSPCATCRCRGRRV